MNCLICKKKVENNKGLASHIRFSHSDISVEEYYRIYISEDDACLECGNKANFISLSKGYRSFCSSKCSNSNESKKRKETETKIKTKFGEAQSKRMKDKFKDKDFLKNNTENRMKTIYEKYGKTNFRFLKTKDELKEIYDKRLNTCINNGYFVPLESKSDFEIYTYYTRKETEKQYKEHMKYINPNSLNRGRNNFHLDHKFSILEGFKNNIPHYIIGNKINLEMITEKENCSKQANCSITKEELINAYFIDK